MPTITSIEPQQRNPRRVNIHIDGQFALAVADILAAWLKVGQQVSEVELAALKDGEARESAYQKALHFISIRPRSSAEVRRNLTRRGLEASLVEATLQRLQENKLLDDRAFTRLWVENRSTFRPRSRAALRMELRRLGLAEEIIQPVLDESVDEQALAFQAARKQARRYAGLDRQTFRRKMAGFLARRGFSYDNITPVISEVWQEMQTADAGQPLENEVEK